MQISDKQILRKVVLVKSISRPPVVVLGQGLISGTCKRERFKKKKRVILKEGSSLIRVVFHQEIIQNSVDPNGLCYFKC